MAEESDGSIFSKLKKDAPPAPEAARPAAAAPSSAAASAVPAPLTPPPLPPVSDSRLAGLEASIRALRSELDALKNKPAVQPPAALPPVAENRLADLEAGMRKLHTGLEALTNRPAPPTKGMDELVARLTRAESIVLDLRCQLAEGEEAVNSRVAQTASKDEMKMLDLRLADLGAAFSGLKRTFAGEAELAARLELTERSLAELNALRPGQQAQLKASLDSLVSREEVDALRVNITSALGSLEEMKRGLLLYSEDFSGVERECRKALGEMRGYMKSAAQKPLEARFDEYLKEVVAGLSGKLAEVETAMHAGLAELSGRLTTGEVLYKKMFTEAEACLRESIEPELKSVDSQLKDLRGNLNRLSDDYAVMAERKLRALEFKYSAFEAMSRRMDDIEALLRKAVD